ncbi:hypothetical protein GFS31_33140 [Leptolyngbya sp. BL0902]|nr:hypothetical protein GFS31_33140 [Leptolyngbya sp. BL0902]
MDAIMPLALPLLTTRPELGQADLPTLVAFYEACEQADPRDHAPTLDQLQHRLDHPPPGGRHRRQYWETADGQLVGVVNLWMTDPRTDIPPEPSLPASFAPPTSQEKSALGPYPPVVNGHLGIMVHPSYRHQGLESTLLDWAENFVQTYGQTTQRDGPIPVYLRATVAQDRTVEQESYGAHGFQMVRCFQTLQRSLLLPVDAPSWPAGFGMQRADTVQVEDWVALFNDAFVDHWRFVPLTVAQHQHRRQSPTYQPDLDWVAVAADGTLVGFCTAHIPYEDNARHHRQEGEITLLGTRRGYRRQGLARAMLLYGLQQLQAAGLDTVMIGVDRDNPNQAKALYESLGFGLKESWLNYFKVFT